MTPLVASSSKSLRDCRNSTHVQDCSTGTCLHGPNYQWNVVLRSILNLFHGVNTVSANTPTQEPALALMAPLVPRYHFNPSTRYRSASMRWYPNTYVLASGVIRMGPMVSTPAGSDGMSCLESLR